MGNSRVLNEYQKEIDRYLQSAVRLYGHIPPREFLPLFNRFHKDHKLYKDDLIKWMNKLNRQSEIYRIYTNAIVNITVSDEDIDRIIYFQRGKKFWLPEKEDEFLKWYDGHFCPNTPESEKLSRWLCSEGKVSPMTVQSLMDELFHSVLKDEPIECQMDIWARYNIWNSLSLVQENELLVLFSDFSNHSVHWANCGFTPMDLFRPEKQK